MFYFLRNNKKWADWRIAAPCDLDSLCSFLTPHEYHSVVFTSKLCTNQGKPDEELLHRNTVFIEEHNGNIISALMLSAEGIICPVFTESSSLHPVASILKEFSYIKRKFLTLMGISTDVTTLEKMFRNKNSMAVVYDLLSEKSSQISSAVESYKKTKNKQFLDSLTVKQALHTDINMLMPLRSAYEIEEVVLNPSSFNEAACRNRFLRIIKDEAVFFAEKNGTPAGICCISASGLKWGQVGGVYTRPENRSNGVSALLMGAVAHHAEKNGMNLTLFVKKDNKPALRLYSNCGFKKTGDYRICYLESR